MLLACLVLSAAPFSVFQNQDSTDIGSRVETLALEALAKPGTVGLSIAVGIGKEVVLAQAYGMAELEHGVHADPDTMFRIGSVTKQFTAAAILRLQEREELFVDEDMHAYLPDYDTLGNVVTVRHLLTHTSGIPSYTSVGEPWMRVTPLELTHAELLALVDGIPFDFLPGYGYSYNNTGYYLLGMIIEEVSGDSYAEFLERELFTPLELERIRYDSNAALISNRAQGYRLIDGELANDAPLGMSQPGGAGALIASAKELVRWQIALVNGRVVPPEIYAEMTSPFFLESGSETNYGFGLTWDELEGRRRIRHGGGIFSFKASLQYLPDEQMSVAVLSNSDDFDPGGLATEIARALLVAK